MSYDKNKTNFTTSCRKLLVVKKYDKILRQKTHKFVLQIKLITIVQLYRGVLPLGLPAINTEGYYPLDYPQLTLTFAKFSQKLAVKKRKHMMNDE